MRNGAVQKNVRSAIGGFHVIVDSISNSYGDGNVGWKIANILEREFRNESN